MVCLVKRRRYIEEEVEHQFAIGLAKFAPRAWYGRINPTDPLVVEEYPSHLDSSCTNQISDSLIAITKMVWEQRSIATLAESDFVNSEKTPAPTGEPPGDGIDVVEVAPMSPAHTCQERQRERRIHTGSTALGVACCESVPTADFMVTISTAR
jgi:hypothetical protein